MSIDSVEKIVNISPDFDEDCLKVPDWVPEGTEINRLFVGEDGTIKASIFVAASVYPKHYKDSFDSEEYLEETEGSQQEDKVRDLTEIFPHG